jgi:hypothetical protein
MLATCVQRMPMARERGGAMRLPTTQSESLGVMYHPAACLTSQQGSRGSHGLVAAHVSVPSDSGVMNRRSSCRAWGRMLPRTCLRSVSVREEERLAARMPLAMRPATWSCIRAGGRAGGREGRRNAVNMGTCSMAWQEIDWTQGMRWLHGARRVAAWTCWVMQGCSVPLATYVARAIEPMGMHATM